MNTLLRRTNWLHLLAAWAICLLAGAIGAFATQSSVQTWYPTLEKPAFTPPGWLFGPVWTTLYLMMGVALYLIWERRYFPYAPGALRLFGVQLLLNAAWSVVFFGLQDIGGGLIVIGLLTFFLISTVLAFHRVYSPAGYWLVPYLAWVAFAAVLNAYIWVFN